MAKKLSAHRSDNDPVNATVSTIPFKEPSVHPEKFVPPVEEKWLVNFLNKSTIKTHLLPILTSGFSAPAIGAAGNIFEQGYAMMPGVLSVPFGGVFAVYGSFKVGQVVKIGLQRRQVKNHILDVTKKRLKKWLIREASVTPSPTDLTLLAEAMLRPSEARVVEATYELEYEFPNKGKVTFVYSPFHKAWTVKKEPDKAELKVVTSSTPETASADAVPIHKPETDELNELWGPENVRLHDEILEKVKKLQNLELSVEEEHVLARTRIELGVVKQKTIKLYQLGSSVVEDQQRVHRIFTGLDEEVTEILNDRLSVIRKELEVTEEVVAERGARFKNALLLPKKKK